jgi:hypothetical protein
MNEPTLTLEQQKAAEAALFTPLTCTSFTLFDSEPGPNEPVHGDLISDGWLVLAMTYEGEQEKNVVVLTDVQAFSLYKLLSEQFK